MAIVTYSNKMPKKLTAELTVGANAAYVLGATITGGTSGATAKIVKKKGSTVLVVNNINGMFAIGETVTGVGGGSSAVAANGWQLSITTKGIVKTIRIGTRVLAEVIHAIKGLSTRITDKLTAPTFTLSLPAAATYGPTQVNKVLTFTLAASEAVNVTGLPYILVTFFGGSETHQAVYNPATSTSTSLKFDYTVVTGDTNGQIAAVANSLVFPTGSSVADKLTTGGVGKLASVGYTVGALTGILIGD